MESKIDGNQSGCEEVRFTGPGIAWRHPFGR